jgi:hypothetical protein
MPRSESPIEETNDDVRGTLYHSIEAQATKRRTLGDISARRASTECLKTRHSGLGLLTETSFAITLRLRRELFEVA